MSEALCKINTTTVPGDVDLDGTLSSADSFLMVRHIKGLQKLEGMAFVNAAAMAGDLNQLTKEDVDKTRRCIVGTLTVSQCK